MKVNPISPDEIGTAILEMFPPEVFASFNELIVEKWNGKSSTVHQDVVITRIISKLPFDDEGYPTSRSTVFDKGWLNVEEAYRSQGWIVKYDKPGYNESYSAYFVFSKKSG